MQRRNTINLTPRRLRPVNLLVVSLLAILFPGSINAAGLPGERTDLPAPTVSPTRRDLDRSEWQSLLGANRDSATVSGIQLPDGRIVDLRLQRFRVARPDTDFVVGRASGADAPMSFDADRVVLLKGEVAGEPGSYAFLIVSENRSIGMIDVAGRQYDMITQKHEGDHPVRLEIFEAPDRSASLPPDLPLCGLEPPGPLHRAGSERINGPDLPRTSPGADDVAYSDHEPLPAGEGVPPPRTTQVIEIAVETDHEFFQLIGDEDATVAYVLELYGAMSALFMRDMDIRIEVAFVRVWPDADDLFDEPNPLQAFRDYWNEHMDHVHRDVAQFTSGRRDLPYGGVAYLNGLCNDKSYSVVGYTRGFFPDPEVPHPDHYDLAVTSHELGHNCGTLHTHDMDIDDCQQLDGPARRGTVMSYCSQTRSGGNANRDLRFHTIVQGAMREYIDGVECIDHDCNGNGVSDHDDIMGGTSEDANGNGVPDECEDCNDNGILDSEDIEDGVSFDLNGNGVPDECEPDCNGNTLPDDLDIALGFSTDLYGNGIPDECEADCDGSGTSDYSDILADMSRDINRNTILDECEDCDGDGETDLVALSGANHVWIASGDENDPVREFHSVTGVRMHESPQSVVHEPQDLVIDDAGRIFVSSAADDRVVQLDRHGRVIGDFVTAGSGGLSFPTGMTFGPNGNLLVANRDFHNVLEFDGTTGAFLREFIEQGDAGLLKPFGIAFGPNGNLFVTSSRHEVYEFDGATGEFVQILVNASENGGLMYPHGIAFKPDGNLLVASYATNQILEYNGTTGGFLGQFNNGGTDSALTLDEPWGIRIGPDGDVYVARHGVYRDEGPGGGHHGGDPLFAEPIQRLHINSARIYIFDVDTGIFLRSYVIGNDTDLWEPTGFDFYPGELIDCNVNALPDVCDISSGASLDVNVNGVPDECECLADVDGSGVVGLTDILAVLNGWGPCPKCPEDLDGDGAIGFTDLLLLLDAWGPCE